jgi:chloramphenicol-sensitive protein RarD
MGLILGIFLYKEHFDIYQFTGFIVIWIGLAVFTIGGIRKNKIQNVPVDIPDPVA